MFDLPTWALGAGLVVSLLIIAGVVYRALYSATVYMVRRMQRKGEIPEMTKMQEIDTKLDNMVGQMSDRVDGMELKIDQTRTVVFELEHTVTNGLTTKAKQSRAWQQEYGTKIDQLIGAVNEHLRQSRD
jgi:hypothetical protein